MSSGLAVDRNIVKQFPPGSQIITAYHFGTSSWTNTARLCVLAPDGDEKLYFFERATNETGRLLMEGEFNAQSELHKTIETGTVYVFDSAAFDAHNEMETGNWRCKYNKIHNRVYLRAYLRHFAPSEPAAE
ncbi:hypothetical protein BDW62DRAFT_188381 [Aspergillus aurantiobrunneus]